MTRPRRNEMGELVGDHDRRPTIGSGVAACSRDSIRPLRSTTQRWQTIAIRPRQPNGSTRSNRSFAWWEASAPNSFCPRLAGRRRISASYPTCCPLARIETPSRSKSRARIPATSIWRRGSPRSFAGMRWRWSCARTRPMANSEVMSPATPPPPRFLRSASIISSAGRRANTAAMSSSSNLTQPLASTLELSSKAASPRIG